MKNTYIEELNRLNGDVSNTHLMDLVIERVARENGWNLEESDIEDINEMLYDHLIDLLGDIEKPKTLVQIIYTRDKVEDEWTFSHSRLTDDYSVEQFEHHITCDRVVSLFESFGSHEETISDTEHHSIDEEQLRKSEWHLVDTDSVGQFLLSGGREH